MGHTVLHMGFRCFTNESWDGLYMVLIWVKNGSHKWHTLVILLNTLLTFSKLTHLSPHYNLAILPIIVFSCRIGKWNHKTSVFAFHQQFSKLKILLLAFSFSIICSTFAFRFSLSKLFLLFTENVPLFIFLKNLWSRL